MKKIVSSILVLALALSIAGCSGNQASSTAASSENPTSASIAEKTGSAAVVETFCDAIKECDYEKAASCMENGADDWENLNDSRRLAQSEALLKYLIECAAKMTYEIGEVKEDGDNASTTVTFTYVDATPVVFTAWDEYYAQVDSMTEDEADAADLDALLDRIIEEAVQSVETDTITLDIDFQCIKANGEWKIAPFSYDGEWLITGVMTSEVEMAVDSYAAGQDEECDGECDGDIDDSYDDVDDYNYVYEENDAAPGITRWADVSFGSPINLGTFGLYVSACVETDDLSNWDMNPEEAPDGNKFVIFYVEVQNTTDEEIAFSNVYPLMDSQGQCYDPYYTMYSLEECETFLYTEIEPDEEKAGMFIYVVPEDCEEYYVSVTDPNFGTGARLHVEW